MTCSDLTATRAAYDGLAPIYDVWSAADPAWLPSQRFYLAQAERAHVGVAELCVGTGRIAVEIARRGIPVIGVDFSSEMLARCRERAADASNPYLELIEADVREVTLPRKVDIILLPFRTIGHFLTPADREAVFRTAHNNLVPGGRFVLDHYVFNIQWAMAHNGIPRLLCFEKEPDGTSRSIADTYLYDFIASELTSITSIERCGVDGSVRRTHHRFRFRWLQPDELRATAERNGFRVEALYGDFDSGGFHSDSSNQVWIFHRNP